MIASPAAPPPLQVAWAPQLGSQMLFVACPIYEALIEGTRGAAKTDALLMDFAKDVGRGLGPAWRGILFRESYPQLADITARSKRWFHRVFPDATLNEASHTWKFAGGEELLFRYMERPEDYWNYHGHEYPWIGWEELTNWPNLDCYEAMKACSRCSIPGVPRRIRATANPFGIGHHAVKAYFIDPAPAGEVIRNEQGLQRVRIHAHWSENRALLAADPDYPRRLASDTNPNRRRAWLRGDWDIVAGGGAIDDLWEAGTHVVEPFDIPKSWRIDRSLDWGSSRPFSVGWWAESDGTEATLKTGRKQAWPRRTLFRIAEWYGWTGKANEGMRLTAAEIGRRLIAMEKTMPFAGRVRPGPADSSIFDRENGVCIAEDFERVGVRWEKADKSPGSRKNGLEALRGRLHAALQCPMEEPGIFFFNVCRWGAIRTLPMLIMDRAGMDVDTDQEDHPYDEVRYRIQEQRRTGGGGALPIG